MTTALPARLARALLALLLALAGPAAAQTFGGLMSGAWWDASRGGEGQFISFETVGTRNVVYFAYFTYTAGGAATWHVGNADYVPGATSIQIPVVTGAGARFGAAFRSADARFDPAGIVTLDYVACDRLRLRHSGIPGTTLDLTRLIGPLAGAPCTAPAPTAAVSGFSGLHSGSWWNAARGGEGQFITFETVGARNVVYLAYFTYTADGAATWLVGNADYASGARSVTIPLITGSGARFGTAFRPQDVVVGASGTATLDLTSCSAIRLTYAGTQNFALDLTRLVGPLTGAPCTDAAVPPSAADTSLRFLLAQNGITGNARAGRNLPSIDDPLPQLGKLLFFSKALSAPRDTACASCHHPALGGGDKLAVSIGTGAANPDVLGPGRRLANGPLRVGRNANTIFNIALYDSGLFWDSRVESLGKLAGRNGGGSGIRTPDSAFGFADPNAGATLPAAQARFPVAGPAEMLGAGFQGITGNEPIRNHLAARLGDYGTGQGQLPASQWLAKFRAAFGNPVGTAQELITFANIARAIAEYQRSATFVESPFARYARGDNAALTEQQKQGALLFFRRTADGGAQCVQCHRGESFTGETHHALGFPQVGPGLGDGTGGTDDFGRGRETRGANERYQFRTAALLNVEVTGPWGHSGAYGTLEQAIEHYITPDATLGTFLSARSWCSVPPFETIDCGATVADVTRNSQAALAKLRTEQMMMPGVAMPAVDPARLGPTAVADLKAFMLSLTDPCVKDRACLAKWIPAPGEAPDGLQLNAVDANGNPL
jgi:cytochrome c peroxidase